VCCVGERGAVMLTVNSGAIPLPPDDLFLGDDRAPLPPAWRFSRSGGAWRKWRGGGGGGFTKGAGEDPVLVDDGDAVQHGEDCYGSLSAALEACCEVLESWEVD